MSHPVDKIMADAKAFEGRGAYSAFAKHETHGKLATAMTDKTKALEKALEAAPEGFNTLRAEHADLVDKLENVRKGSDAKAIKDAEEKLGEASAKIEKYLKGDTVDESAKEAQAALTKAYKEAQEAVGKVKGVMDGWFGRVRVNGFGEAAKTSWTQVKEGAKFWDSEATKGKRGVAFGRVGAAGVGAVAVADGIFRSKTGDGEDRSALARLTEVVIGGASIGGAVLAGRAL